MRSVDSERTPRDVLDRIERRERLVIVRAWLVAITLFAFALSGLTLMMGAGSIKGYTSAFNWWSSLGRPVSFHGLALLVGVVAGVLALALSLKPKNE
jgi:cytochrome b subunit of formate dehydrogenase